MNSLNSCQLHDALKIFLISYLLFSKNSHLTSSSSEVQLYVYDGVLVAVVGGLTGVSKYAVPVTGHTTGISATTLANDVDRPFPVDVEKFRN